ncbi:MAG: protein phosphatase CheZ [Alphaproteobacteria bacterium]|nr:protein phosphatase CheZ [Alphaproteobacteria bacterium]
MTLRPQMTTDNANEKDDAPHPELLFSAVNGVAAQLNMIEQFVSRRFDEISMEINATSQQVDMAEEGIAKRFGEILEVLKAVSYSGTGSTAANTGVELDAVVEMTEQAANKILDAADRITTRLHDSKTSGGDEVSRLQALEDINKDVEEIFMACSFQDITGQRIRKALENIRMIEDRLSTALDKMGIHLDVDAENHEGIKSHATSQGDIDALFGSEGGKE